ncbi:M81 family metallopeptidase [Zavarzinia compransoris]|uniref:Microcystinase C n=1 Tax=Zavarzinia compransoris TaxID=1264899 RepID=A0A317DWN4_9PROT|nr:M81 family metallopeptidase [Zavarzinia compransoris]PWR18842.1 microcystin degradation protein MlrC [Zavarzinia compransoris]TDP48833.1 microcystin degradation protein MlrC [Zavarzinia compransoris]
MKVVVAMMKHETNTFSPLVTDLARFEAWGLHFGPAAESAYAETAMPMGAYIRLCRARGAEIVTPVAAEAMPGGIVTRDAYETLAGAIVEAVAAGCDAVLLDLHGAMVAAHVADGEGELLRRLRAVAPRVPIAVTCDLHCNLTRAMVDHCDALIGYKTYPHVDMAEVGERIARVLFAAIDGKARPVMAFAPIPVLAQTLRMGTDDEPMKGLIAEARALEAEGFLAATVFGGFPMADVPHAGMAAVVVGDGDPAAAGAAVERLAALARARRDDFLYPHEPLEHALDRAAALGDAGGGEAGGPVILLDHADNCGSGGTQDVMGVIAAVIERGLKDVAVGAVYDPEAVKTMAAAGVGAEVSLALGGRLDMPALGLKGRPLALTGRVKVLTDGRFVVRGPMYTGVTVEMGPTAVLSVDGGRVEIVVTSHHHEPWDRGVFTSVGIEPEAKRFLLLKSRIHYRAGFAALARATVTLDGEGVTTSDNGKLDYRRLRRPLYPFDRIN